MADVDLLRDPEQLRQDAGVLEAWADCVGGNRLDIVRRAAAALREIAKIYSYANLDPIGHTLTSAPDRSWYRA